MCNFQTSTSRTAPTSYPPSSYTNFANMRRKPEGSSTCFHTHSKREMHQHRPLPSLQKCQAHQCNLLCKTQSSLARMYPQHKKSINLLLFLQKQNLATAIYLFGLGTLLTGLGLKHMRICSHHDLIGALVTSLFPGGPWWSTTSPTCLPLSVFTITSDQHRCRIPPLL